MLKLFQSRLTSTIQTVPTKWSVVPHSRTRSATTERLWINRHTQKQKQTSTSCPLIISKRQLDSYVEEYLPFKSDPSYLEDYQNVYGTIRTGKILEDLDALAGSIAYTHCDDFRDDTPPLTLVTASLEGVEVFKSVPTDQDVRICGFCSFVGSSSLEISIIMETVKEGVDSALSNRNDYISSSEDSKKDVDSKMLKKFLTNDDGFDDALILKAKFIFVAVDPKTNRATKVNQLEVKSDDEIKLFQIGKEQKEQNRLNSLESFEKKPPTSIESKLIHDMYIEYINRTEKEQAMPKDLKWMKDTEFSSNIICMPQERNIHNKIFGGYLMRIAYELAWITAIQFAEKRPIFTSLDNVQFKKPVAIGSLLSLKSAVIYSDVETNIFKVKVRADVFDPVKHTSENSNVFWFSFRPAHGVVPKVWPRSYEESLKYLEGKRKS